MYMYMVLPIIIIVIILPIQATASAANHVEEGHAPLATQFNQIHWMPSFVGRTWDCGQANVTAVRAEALGMPL
ncbi:hypothetical protein COO60DRAFT_1479622 [Scenedesmus sp. NREL 46B-D3]|nr:hypothetical protein COO60DRAFT_1479622 [Scenedesmus sp. NREL 46B-D3]